MKHWAKVKTENGIHTVIDVLVANESDLKNIISNVPAKWIETFPDANGDSKKRYNYASVGYVWDVEGDFFYKPSQYASWKLDSKKIMQPPVAQGTKANSPYTWDEASGAWK